MSDGTGNMAKIWGVAAAVGVASFAVLIFTASYDTGPAVLLAILIALLVATLMWIGFYRDDEGADGADTGAATGGRATAAPAGAASPAADAPAPRATTSAEKKAGGAAAKPAASKPAASKPAASKPATKQAAKPTDASSPEAGRPAPLSAPRGGKADDLKQIKGVGPKLEQLLNSLGVYHFDQIAAWSAEEIAWLDANLKGFKGRASRDNWVEQARILAQGGSTEFSQRVRKGDVY